MNLTERDRERDALLKLIGNRNKAELARKIGIGTPPVVSQHLSGRRPISLEQGVAYATEFGITLDALSPRLAAVARQAAALLPGAGVAGPAAAPTLPDALPVVLKAMADLPPARRVSVQAQLDLVLKSPSMLDDVLPELQHLLSAPPGKAQRPAA